MVRAMQEAQLKDRVGDLILMLDEPIDQLAKTNSVC